MYPPPTATAPPLSAVVPALPTQFFHHHHSLFSQRHTFTLFFNSKSSLFYRGLHSRFVLGPAFASISRYSYEESEGRACDPELRRVLELATDSELYELERILFGPSYFSPLLKSVLQRDEVDHFMIGEDPNEREDYISMLESRFLFLAADARSTLRGWRPSYRSVLLGVRKKLKIPCSAKLSAEDLEVEIFLHLLQEYSSEEQGSSEVSSKNADGSNSLELGLSQWKVQKLTALGIGATDIRSLILKGGGMLTLEKLLESLGGRFSGKLFTEAAKYQMKKELIKKGGQLAAINLESGAALLAARQGLKAAAVRYLGLRSVTQLFGPLMWGTLLADVFIQMLGTDYARILRAIYALAQEFSESCKYLQHRWDCAMSETLKNWRHGTGLLRVVHEGRVEVTVAGRDGVDNDVVELVCRRRCSYDIFNGKTLPAPAGTPGVVGLRPAPAETPTVAELPSRQNTTAGAGVHYSRRWSVSRCWSGPPVLAL
ncbi:hypothetical protein C2S53_005615 [Perilla frutescens var. hirtella]|uniref:Uncharacterized protein n=1 Tax=Perilla frutescens var. hirtella TaxID=608512 RepID=A0AAD4JF36_PERFH|nr:hypothetical protein C2S53_005615 [Perilla frutescens var. hirtella]